MNNKQNTKKDTVLVVEDTAANHEVIRVFLNDIGVQCESAFDGMEAITMCSSCEPEKYTLILMDINLPHMDGFETTSKLRKLGIQTPVIAVTASSKDDKRIDPAKDAFDALLFKPFNSSEFYAAISPYIKNAVAYSLESERSSGFQPGRCFEDIPDDRKDAFSMDQQVCDINRGIANMGNNPRLFAKHLNNFKRNNADLAFRLDTLIHQEKYDECSTLCHSIKGLSGMLGLTGLYDHVVELEKLVNTNSPQDDMSHLLLYIAKDIRLVCQMQF